MKKKQTERVEKITVTDNRATAPSIPYCHLEYAPSESTADPDDDMDTESIGSDLVLADMSDSDTRSVDFLLDDYGCVSASRGFPKVSVWTGDVIEANQTELTHISAQLFSRRFHIFLRHSNIFSESNVLKLVFVSIEVIVNRVKWLWSPVNVKRTNKDAKIITVHNLNADTLWLNHVTETFLLVSCLNWPK